MLELYHGTTSVCAQKVRLTLAEKDWHGRAIEHKLTVAQWWERVKSRPSYQTAITGWLRPEDLARYEKMTELGLT